MSENIVIAKARENLKAASLCAREQLHNASVSRSYYGCTQLAAACLLRWGCLPDKPNHDRIISIFKSQWKARYGRTAHLGTLELLFAARYDADYAPHYRFSGAESLKTLLLAQDFFNYVVQKERLLS